MFDCGKQLIICFYIDKNWNLWGFDMYNLLLAYTFPSWKYFKIVNLLFQICGVHGRYAKILSNEYTMLAKVGIFVSGMVQMLHRN